MRLRNKFEKRIAKELKRLKVDFEYEGTNLSYILVGKYIPDFVLHLPSGKEILVEAKGYLRPEHRRKMVAVRKQHPEKDIRLLFYSKRKEYIKWAEKHGFPWAVESIPKEWLQ